VGTVWARSGHGPRRERGAGLFRVLLLVGFVAKFWWVILAALGAVVLFVGLLWLAFYARAVSTNGMRSVPRWWPGPIRNPRSWGKSVDFWPEARYSNDRLFPMA
jgi:hypothetical protein